MPFYFLIFLLIFAPLAYGTTGPIAMTIVQTVVLSALLWVVVEAVLGRRKLYRPPGLLPLSLLGTLMLLQLLPLPPGLLSLISPVTAQRYAETTWLLRPDAWMPLSFNVQRTLTAFFYFFTCLGFYLFAVQPLSSRRYLQKTVRILTTFAGLYALLSILEALLPNGRILWLLRPWPDYAGKPFGTYVNGNHFAGLMAMLLPVTVMHFLVEKPVTQYGNWKERLIDFCSDLRLGAYLITGFAALLTATSIFLSLSRGGILSSLGAMLILCLLLLWRRHYRRQALILVGFIVLLFFFVGIFGWSSIFESFARIRNLQGDIYDGRLVFWRDCLPLFGDFPLLGTGFGSFIDSYPAYQSIDVGASVVDHAHNEYIELFAEGGLAGLLLALWALWSVLRGSWKAFARRRDLFSVSLYLGSLAGCCALLLHSLTEFNLHIGANGLYFAFMVALLVSCAFSTARRGVSSELAQLNRRHVRYLVPLVVLGLFGALLFNAGGLSAEKLMAVYLQSDLAQLDESEKEVALQTTLLASSRAPLDAEYRFSAAKILAASDRHQDALEEYAKALRLRPLNSEYLQRAADSAGKIGDLALQAALLKSGVKQSPMDLSRTKAYVDWLLAQRRYNQAFDLIRSSLGKAPEKTNEFLTQMVLYGVEWPRMKEALPERSIAWLHYAGFLLKFDQGQLAEYAYRHAVRLVEDEPLPDTRPYIAFNRYLQKQQRYEEAMVLMLDSIDQFPTHAELHAEVATLFERQGFDSRAIEAYQQALLLNPKLKWVRKRLEKLQM